MAHPTTNGRQAGFTYIALLIGVAIVGATLAAVGQVWQTVQRHEQEQELIFIGNQFRVAIDRYYANNRRFPMSLDDLLRDDHDAGLKRHLRKIFVDPVTRRAEWGLVTMQDGQILGVHSLSENEPLKKKGFRQVDADLKDKNKYTEWVFMSAVRGTIYNPANQPSPGPGSGPTVSSPLSSQPGSFLK